MTARTCPVHGEYSTTGVCRWCEPETLLDVAKRGRSVLPVSEPTPWVGGRLVPAEEITDAIRERRFAWPIYRPTAADLPIQPPVVLEYQHAALRWERVAVRWEAKHRAKLPHGYCPQSLAELFGWVPPREQPP